MTSKTKPAAKTEDSEATRIDMNDPTLSDAEAVARNLGYAVAESEPLADKA